MTKRVHVFSETDDVLQAQPVPGCTLAVLGFWASPEFAAAAARHLRCDCVSFSDIAPTLEETRRAELALARRLTEAGPTYRGVNPLRGWEESVADALTVPLATTRLFAFLLEHVGAGARVTWASDSDLARALCLVNKHRDAPFSVQPPAETSGPFCRLSRRLRHARRLLREAVQSGRWSPLWQEPLDIFDSRYRARGRTARPPRPPRGRTWFYSTYVNYTKVLKAYARGAQVRPRWLVNNYSGLRGIPDDDPCVRLWQFHGPARQTEHEAVQRAVKRTLQGLTARLDGVLLRSVLRSSREVRGLLRRVLPRTLVEIDLLNRFFDRAAPDALWVANQWGSEGALIQVAEQRSVPVTQVQHGTLRSNFGASPVYSDRLWVWGDFWRRVVSTEGRNRVFVVSPGGSNGSARNGQPDGRPRITFFTSPLHRWSLANWPAARWEVVQLLARLHRRGHPITIRAHPADQLSAWTAAWERWAGPLPDDLVLDKGGPLQPVLHRTDLALMFCSTVFVDCVASGIPVVSLGWHPFLWRREVEKEGYVQFAGSLEAVEAALAAAAAPGGAGDLLAPRHPAPGALLNLDRSAVEA